LVQVPSQAIWPAVGQRQAPLVQVVPLGHEFSQLPQCAGSVDRSTHVPLQETLPAVHKQRPAVQTLPAPQLAFVMHATQRLVVVSQYGVFPLQVVLSVH
jgi:hypothetical protein